MVGMILYNHGVLIKKMRIVLKKAGEINDEGTIDMIGSYLSDLEKSSWMLDAWRAHQLTMV
jgi:starvation-inducible DNA-binding protein